MPSRHSQSIGRIRLYPVQSRGARHETLPLSTIAVSRADCGDDRFRHRFGCTEALKRTLLAAKSIVYTDPAIGGASGIQFEKVIDRLGIAKEIKAKSIVNARAAIKPSAEFVARGEAELGIQLISEIVSVPGAELLGPPPGDLQAMTAILAGILTAAPEPDAARALLRFLTSPAAAAAIKAAGMEPGGS